MPQNYLMPLQLTDARAQAMTVSIPESMEALRTQFAGATEPSAKAAFQLWADTTTGWLKIRNAANSAWLKLAPLAADHVLQLPSQWDVASLSATTTKKIGAAPRAGTIKRLCILGETASTSSSGNEWQPMLKKYPNSAPGSPVNLFSGAVGTFTALGGVGGGVEFVAHKVLAFTPNQNATVLLDDVLELVLTKVGSATTLSNVSAWVEME